MDYRHLLFINCIQGLKLQSDDLLALLDPLVDFENPEAVASCLRSQEAMDFVRRRTDWAYSARQIELAGAAEGVRWSHLGCVDYPAEWLFLDSPPPVFSYIGEPSWMRIPMLSVVGSRTPMPQTLRWMQRELGSFLKAAGAGVVSGGARGVDQWAHRISMDSGYPTVCLLPTGIAHRYPPGSEAFWDRILGEGGALVSTFAPQEKMRKNHFHIRNCWIAAFSRVSFVAEANRRSGSLITADRAFNFGRRLCTLPLSPLSDQGLANLDLIERGAKALRTHKDLLEVWKGEDFRSIPVSDFLARSEEKLDSPTTS
jgi:DNA processing protein